MPANNQQQQPKLEYISSLGRYLSNICPCIDPPGHQCSAPIYHNGAYWYGACQSVSSLNSDNLEPQPLQQEGHPNNNNNNNSSSSKKGKQTQQFYAYHDEYMTPAPMTTGSTASAPPGDFSSSPATNYSDNGGGRGTYPAASDAYSVSSTSSSRAGTVAGPSGTRQGDTPLLQSPTSSSYYSSASVRDNRNRNRSSGQRYPSSASSSSRRREEAAYRYHPDDPIPEAEGTRRYDEEEYYDEEGASGYSGGSGGYGYPGGSSYDW